MKRFFHPHSARRLLIIVLVGCLAVTAIVGWSASQIAERLSLREIAVRAEATLELQAAALDSLLDKYRILPPVLARRPDVVALVRQRNGVAGRQIAITAAGMTGAEEVRFLDPRGHLIASSDIAAKADPSDAKIVEAVEQARQGRLGRQLVVTRPEGSASYVFAAAVRYRSSVAGIVAVRVGLDRVEQAWALARDPVMALDPDDVIVATNRASWRGLRLQRSTPSTPEASVGLTAQPVDRAGVRLAALPNGEGHSLHLKVEKPLAVLGWKVAVFAGTAAAAKDGATAGAVAALLCLLASGILWAVAERRRQFLQRMRDQRAAALKLERRVRDRTRDLTQANTRLAREVLEREAAESELRRTQDELVQTAKLATLGQMSAALSHEFNQPLAIIRSHADNAGMLLARSQPEAAGESIGKIVAMVERMAKISSTLKGFARKPGKDVGPVLVAPVVDEALMLLSPRIKRSQASITFDRPVEGLAVAADHVRLEQVVMNLLANALDAVAGREDAHVRIGVFEEEEEAVIRISDNGVGIDPGVRANVFDPFFTTKDVGEGLGLGLPIADKIVRDFGGHLILEHTDVNGTVFGIRLPRMDRARAAAE